MRERVILHSDLNNFFASVEMVLNPDLRGKPLIVCGDPKERKGVVLAKNYEAKAFGIQTAETVVSALKKCPHVLRCPPHQREYARYSKQVQEIYARFTDRIEVCSIDECALDVTESVRLFGSGEEIAEKIRVAVKEETGLTVSIGVSFNRIFAKLASEIKKPDAVTVLTRGNYQKIIYPLPASDLLYVGKRSAELLARHNIKTIGDIARINVETLVSLLGKRGKELHAQVHGEGETFVRKYGEKEEVKSIGNSMTLPKDVRTRDELKRSFYILAESVSARLREANVGKCNTVHIMVKDAFLQESTKQRKISPTTLCSDIAKSAFELYCEHYPEGVSVHALGISLSGFDNHVEQLFLGGDEKTASYEKRERAEDAIAKIRKKYGFAKIKRGVILEEEPLNSDED